MISESNNRVPRVLSATGWRHWVKGGNTSTNIDNSYSTSY